MSWALGAGAVKIGILLSYWRVFAVYHIRRLILIVMIAVALTHTALVFAFVFQCKPIHAFWAGWEGRRKGYSCFHQDIFYITGGILNIIGDVTVLIIPIRPVWNLPVTKAQKIMLTFLFLLGGL